MDIEIKKNIYKDRIYNVRSLSMQYLDVVGRGCRSPVKMISDYTIHR